MQRLTRRTYFLSTGLGLALVMLFAATSESVEPQNQEPELMIVKYGSVSIKSTAPGAKVYVDDVYKGSADSVVESIITGEHVIACRTDDNAVSGTFLIKKNETLRLEARFAEGKLVLFREPEKPEAEKKHEPVKRERQKQVAPEPKAAEQRNPAEERRKQQLNVVRFNYDVTKAQQVSLEHAANQQAIAKYVQKKNSTGKYYRTKQGVLLCDAGPCELTWSSTFTYTDEAGKTDAMLLNWKETVFNGITPAGTSKTELEWCLNGQCRKFEDTSQIDMDQEFELDRYQLHWSKTSVLIRRSDIVQEIINAGRSLSDYN